MIDAPQQPLLGSPDVVDTDQEFTDGLDCIDKPLLRGARNARQGESSCHRSCQARAGPSVTVVNLEELLTLVVRPEGELGPSSRRLVERQPDLSAMIATMLWKRLPHLSLEEVMTIAGIQLAELSETRAYQEILAKGREEGREEGREAGLEQGLEKGLEQGRQEGREQGFREEAAELVLRQLRRRFGSVSADDAATIGGLSTAELEDLAEALLEFGSPLDLNAWLANHRGD